MGEDKRRTLASLGEVKGRAQDLIDARVTEVKGRMHDAVSSAGSAAEVEAVVASFAAALETFPSQAEGHRLANRIGPCWTLEGAATRMRGRTGQPLHPETLRIRAAKGTLVGVQAADDRRWYLPAWQFTTDRGRLAVRDAIVALWRLLPRDAASAWTHAAWMVSPLNSLEGRSPVGWVGEHELDDTVRAAARRVSTRLSA
jgi:hypothetical protein